MAPLLVDIIGLAELLSVRPSVVREWEANNEMPSPITINGQRRWVVSDIKRWLEGRREHAGA